MKYHIVSLGCQMNRSDTERIRTVLDGMGYSETDNDDDSMINGIVTCSVRQKAIDRVYGKIRKWNTIKSGKPLITFVSGCILPADRGKFLKLFDLVFSIDQLPELPNMLWQYGVPTPSSLMPLAMPHSTPRLETEKPDSFDARRRIEKFWSIKPRYTSQVEAYVPIQNGCNKFCSFCAVPYTRGREVSRPSQDILAEVKSLVAGGCKSITLLGQNVNSYGLDSRGKELSFPRLLREIGEIGHKSGQAFWIYFTSPHPRDITRELLEVMSTYSVLADWIHLPLQSGDDAVLLRMNRNHTIARYRTVVQDIRHILPNAALFTDIIVGFSGESEKQFQATAEVMREFQYNMAYIAQYSPRPGTRSAQWDDNVSRKEKERRYRILSSVLLEIAEPINLAKVGMVFRVLVVSENRKSGFLSGYTEGRIPVRLKAEEAYIGEFVHVKITATRPLSMEGEVVRNEFS